MSYPRQVPPGWTKGEPVRVFGGGGPRYAIERDRLPGSPVNGDEFAITFDSHEDCVAWLKWWLIVGRERTCDCPDRHLRMKPCDTCPLYSRVPR